MKPIVRGLLVAVVALGVTGMTWARDITAGADEVDEETYVHTNTAAYNPNTVFGTFTSAKTGLNFDGGDAVAFLKWDMTTVTSPVETVYADFVAGGTPAAGGDGSFTIHQLLMDWDESTLTFNSIGAVLPVAGEDYVREPVAVTGFNNVDGDDRFDLTKLFQYWKANPGSNKGVILVPRGQLNPSLTYDFKEECILYSHERVVGLDDGDQWVVATTGITTVITNVLEPVEDTYINEGSKDAAGDSVEWRASIYDAVGSRHFPLLKFAFGDLMMDGADLSYRGFTQADLDVRVLATSYGVTCTVHRALTAWDEATATWNQFGASGPQAGTDYVAAPLATFEFPGGGSQTLDIKELASDWWANPADNHGLILIPTHSGSMPDNVAVVTGERVWGLDGSDTRLTVTVAGPRGTVVVVK